MKSKNVQEVLKKVHDEAGHVGISNTRRNCIRNKSSQIWWPGINVDIKVYNSKCPSCVQSGPPPAKCGELQSIEPPKKPFSFWGMDHKDVGVVTDSGNRFLNLWITQRVSGVSLIHIFPSKETKYVVRSIKDLISWTGPMVKILSDNALEFKSLELKNYYEAFSI